MRHVLCALRYCPHSWLSFFFFNDTATTEIYTLSLHDALPIYREGEADRGDAQAGGAVQRADEQRLRLAHAEDQREHQRRGRDDPPLPAVKPHAAAPRSIRAARRGACHPPARAGAPAPPSTEAAPPAGRCGPSP